MNKITNKLRFNEIISHRFPIWIKFPPALNYLFWICGHFAFIHPFLNPSSWLTALTLTIAVQCSLMSTRHMQFRWGRRCAKHNHPPTHLGTISSGNDYGAVKEGTRELLLNKLFRNNRSSCSTIVTSCTAGAHNGETDPSDSKWR